MRIPTPAALAAILRRMRSVGFSQYGEDVVLYSTLFPRANGYYCDIGAYHPELGSNTFKLYMRGWRGLTIEPNPEVASAFRRYRPADKHLVMGVAEQPATLTYHRFKQDKFNTFELDEYRSQLERSGSPLQVPCLPLSDILDQHAEAPIDFLTVDCEGLDLEVLKSNDWTRFRPRVVMVEDFDEFRRRRDGGASESAIAAFLRDLDYRCIAQTLFTFIYVDWRLRDVKSAVGFNFPSTQIG
ncbi:MAG: FkbM family methyltransferase [Hyphomonadaceae bacterium]|nr:FkbM family methyltransferase [Hyphomonadaceae bacterium]